MLEGRDFVIFSDHKPLSFALQRVSEPWSARQQRQLAYVAEFTSKIQHVPGLENVVADALSRPPPTPSDPPAAQQQYTAAAVAAAAVDFQWLAAEQEKCADCEFMCKQSSLQVRQVQWHGVAVWCDFSTGSPRPLVPAACRAAVFDSLHGLAHPGVRGTRRLISSRFVWPKMAGDIREMCRGCVQCARSKVHVHVKSAVQAIEIPPRPFSHIHVDLVGPLPASRGGKTHLFTIMDRSTRWVEAVPLADTTAAGCAAAMIESWISRFGLPVQITSDRGPQFTSALWSQVCQCLGITIKLTTAYHPQANGLLERFHRQLKAALRARLVDGDWEQLLPWVLLGLRAVPKEDFNVSAAELVFGFRPRLPGELLAGGPAAEADLARRVCQAATAFTALPLRIRPDAEVVEAAPTSLQKCNFVYVRRDGGGGNALSPKYDGPFKVLVTGPKYFRLAVGMKQEVVSVDRLKPHLGQGPVQPAVPPRRGRPRLVAAE
jgi:transposase InsO family protein